MKNGKIDQEIKVIKRVVKAVEGLDDNARWRVLNYVMAVAGSEPIPYITTANYNAKANEILTGAAVAG